MEKSYFAFSPWSIESCQCFFLHFHHLGILTAMLKFSCDSYPSWISLFLAGYLNEVCDWQGLPADCLCFCVRQEKKSKWWLNKKKFKTMMRKERHDFLTKMEVCSWDRKCRKKMKLSVLSSRDVLLLCRCMVTELQFTVSFLSVFPQLCKEGR